MAFFKKSKYLDNADKLVRQNKLKAAIEELLKYNSKAPGDINVINRIGDLYAQVGQTKEAVDYFQKSVDHYSGEGFMTKAIAILKKIVRVDPENIRVYEQLAAIYLQEGNRYEAKRQYLAIVEICLRQKLNKRALETYSKIVELEPFNVDYRLKLADLFIREGDQSEAANQLVTLSNDLVEKEKYSEAEKVLLKTKRLGIKESSIDITLANAMLRQGKVSDAENVLLEAMKEYPKTPSILSMFGKIKLEMEQLADAFQYLSKAFKADPSDDENLKLFIEKSIELSELDKAWKATNVLLEHYDLHEKNSEMIALLKSFIMKSDHFIPALEKLADLFKSEGETVFQISTLEKLAKAYLQNSDKIEAKKTYKKLAELDPSNVDFQSALKRLGGKAEVDQDVPSLDFSIMSEEDSVEESIEDDLSMEDSFQKSLGNVAEAEMYIEYGYTDKAFKLLLKIVEKNPFDIKANELLGKLRADKGEIAGASKCYLTSAEERFKKGQQEKGMDLLEKSEQLLPGSSAYLKRMYDVEEKDSLVITGNQFDFDNITEVDAESMSESFEISPGEIDSIMQNNVLDDEPIGENDSVSEAVLFGNDDLELEKDAISLTLEDMEDDDDLEIEMSGRATEDLSEQPPLDTQLLDSISEDTSEESGFLFDDEDLDFEDSEFALEEDEDEEVKLNLDDSVVLEPASKAKLPDFQDVPLDDIELSEDIDDEIDFQSEFDLDFSDEVEEPVVEKQLVEPEPVASAIKSADITDEIAEIEFYLTQELIEEAKELFEVMKRNHPNHHDLAILEKKINDLEEKSQESFASHHSSNLEELFQEEFIDLKDEFGADMDIFTDNTELTDKQQPQEQIKSLDELFHEFKKGVEEQIDHEDFETHYNLGIAYKEMGLYNEAIEEFAKASHDKTRFIDCCFMASSVYEQIGNIDQAVEWLESGIAKCPELGKDPNPLLYEAGAILERAGENEKAQKYFLKIHKNSPDFRDVSDKI